MNLHLCISFINKGNNKQTDNISQQPENWENCNGPDLVQAFLKKWWVESDFTAPNLPLPLRLKCFIPSNSIEYEILTAYGQL